VKSHKHVVPMLVALTLAAMLGGCSKNTTPAGLDQTLDQAPLESPSTITAERLGDVTGPVTLEWAASSSASVASYQVYQYSPSPDQERAHLFIGGTAAATTQYTLPIAATRETIYYRLRATSTTGVQSDWSEVVPVAAAPWVGGEAGPGDGVTDKILP
jgi:hypothetical protein